MVMATLNGIVTNQQTTRHLLRKYYKYFIDRFNNLLLK